MDVFYFSSISSTNDYAKILLDGRNDVMVHAKYQTNGRGRNHKVWVGDYGSNVYVSIGIDYKDKKVNVGEEMLRCQSIGCLAVKEMLEKLAPELTVTLKYPNDVYIRQKSDWKKIAGVLVENEFVGIGLKSSVLGIGVNCSQIDFGENVVATSLKKEGVNIPTEVVKNVLFGEIQKLMMQNANQVITQWKAMVNMKGKTITKIGHPGEWVVQGFDDYGMLIANNEHEKITITNGDTIRYELSGKSESVPEADVNL